jgi:uncharacterized protein (TIGR02594 family)
MSALLDIALSQYGISEFPGDDSNPEIDKYFGELGFEYREETAWCSAFLNWCCYRTDNSRTRKLNARSWLNIGEKVEGPRVGDIIILWREDPDSWKGHVGIYINEQDVYYNVLGGNQNNSVCIKQYPKHRLLGFRRLEK